MNAAQLLVSCLESEGVRFAFGIPGEENLELMDALRGSSVRFVLTRHEGAAAFMADVSGRLSGHAGVCLATLGPGATNLVTGVADAFLDRAPLVAITAQANLSKIHREAHQYVDILQLFGPITKWNARVESPDVVPEIVRKAFKLAEAEKPGSTHVELPENVAEEEADPDQKPLPREPVSAPTPARASVEQAALLIEKAVRPVILAGNGVIRNGSSAELTQFAERLQIPVVTTVMGKGAIPWTSPMSLVTIGILPRDHELKGFDDSDLVICIGYDFVEYDPRSWNPRRPEDRSRRRAPCGDFRSLPPRGRGDRRNPRIVAGLGAASAQTTHHGAVGSITRGDQEEVGIGARRARGAAAEPATGPVGPARDPGTGRPPHLGRGRSQAVAQPLLPRREAEDDHHLERPLPHGHRPAGRNCRQVDGSGPSGRHAERIRRVPHERARARDREARERRHGEHRLPGWRAGEHPVEAVGEIQADGRHGIRQSGLVRSGEGVRSQGLPRRSSVRVEFHPAGSLGIEGSMSR